MLTGSQIRRKFLDFFIEKGHREVHSSSLVPANDPTLLFTNAGMNQFKDVFLGLEKRDYSRATTSQKCVRAGGKHNDLENVGFTNRHHTFFEMLGNFSFGDYFKKDAIAYAWELITSPDWFGIDKGKLYVTIFKGENGVDRDSEAYDLWLGQGVPKERIYAFGSKDNFWQMGDTGPCGPCSEIHYDMGVIASDQGHKDCEFGCDCGRYVEIWNLVFMQFDRVGVGIPDPRTGRYPEYKLNPLPKPSIDTGMGLERVASVMQGVISNYETDLFTPLIKRATELTAVESITKTLDQGPIQHGAASLRVIADHARAATFLISDGVTPSNEGRGYVLRKIIRRAITHGRLLGQTKPFLHEMVFAVRDLMQDAFPELKETAERVMKVVLIEETRFANTLGEGLRRLTDDLEVINILDALPMQDLLQIKKWLQAKGEPTSAIDLRLSKSPGAYELPAKPIIAAIQDLGIQIPRQAMLRAHEQIGLRARYRGLDAFRLYDTFGLPLDFMQDAARDRGVEFDQAGFDAAMTEQRERARASWKGAAKHTANPVYQEIRDRYVTRPHPGPPLPGGVPMVVPIKSNFEGYTRTRSEDCAVLAIVRNGRGATDLKPGEEGEIILDHTPFYAESGGQVGDRGSLYSDDHNTVVAEVSGCYYPIQGVRAHQVVAKQPIRVGQKVDAVVNTDTRSATMRNHTATHLLQAGLREVLGKHVKQAGSLVAPNHLRFDFSHFTGVADEELQDIEDIINKEVLRNEQVKIIEDVPIDVAVNEYHAMALFGEKYGDKVRVIKIGGFSTELCGGTHTLATGEIGLIKILKEGSVSSGVRRIEAVTGENSLRHFREDHLLEKEARQWIVTERKGLSPKIEELDGSVRQFTTESSWRLRAALRDEFLAKDAEIKRLTRELDQARMKSASSGAANAADKTKDVKGIKVLAHRADNLERAQMRTLVDQLRDKLGSGVVVVGSATDGNVSLIAGVTKDLTGLIQAGKVVGKVAEKVGGKGGGRPDLAEAGGKDAAALDSALADVYNIVETLLG